MLESKCYWFPAGSLLSWVVAAAMWGGIKNQANSVSFQLKLPVWTKFGKTESDQTDYNQNKMIKIKVI